MAELKEKISYILKNNLTEVEAIDQLKDVNLNISEAYEICLNEFKHFNREKLRAAVMKVSIEKMPIKGYYNKYGITVLPSEED